MSESKGKGKRRGGNKRGLTAGLDKGSWGKRKGEGIRQKKGGEEGKTGGSSEEEYKRVED